jgi:beta-lactamase regulating signal transducer with metallopeptidase domain
MNDSIQAISQIAAAALISSIWQGLILTAIIWVCMKLAPRTAAGIRFIIWTAVFAAIALLPVFSILSWRSVTTPSPASIQPAIQLDSRWALVIAALWGVFSIARAIGLAGNAFRLGSLWKRSTPIEATPAIAALLTRVGFRRVHLCASPEIDQPCVIGFFAPRILVPDWLLEKATPAELEQIVLHEVTHLRRFDDWTNLVQKIAVACFPLSPALVWVERRLCVEREVACDDGVVRATRAPREYATCLTNLAEQRFTRASAALSLGAWARRSQLAARVDSILRSGSGLSPLKARAVMAALITVTAGSAIKLGGAAQVISFTSRQDDRAFAQADQRSAQGTMPGARYRNVVFHASSAADGNPLLQGDVATTDPRPPIKEAHRPVLKASLRRANFPADGVESLIIVTRWQSSSGQQMTVIDQVVRISALSAAQSQAGWFVVQL